LARVVVVPWIADTVRFEYSLIDTIVPNNVSTFVKRREIVRRVAEVYRYVNVQSIDFVALVGDERDMT
jgi:mannitol-1-phosphate/altronate dehydrogenase